MAARLSLEFRLAAACCVWPPTERRTAAIRAAATDRLCWDRVLRVVKRHRIAALVVEGLVAAGVHVPPAILANLKASALTNIRQNFCFTMEACRLQDLLVGASIPVVFVKGATLAVRAFQTLALRHSKDIDFLVYSRDVKAASAILGQAGYSRIRPPPSIVGDRLEDWHRLNNQTEWVHRTMGHLVELHWCLTPIQGMLREPLTLEIDHQDVEIAPNISLRTIRDDKLLVYLCVHGASHAWFRLKWLADVGALLARLTDAQVEKMYCDAQCSGDGRAVGQALLLCEHLFGTPFSRTLSKTLRRAKVQRVLAWIALKAMTRGGAEVETDALRFGSTLITASHLLLPTRWRYFTAQFLATSIHFADLTKVPLPRRLHCLYPLLRLPLWLWRRVI